MAVGVQATGARVGPGPVPWAPHGCTPTYPMQEAWGRPADGAGRSWHGPWPGSAQVPVQVPGLPLAAVPENWQWGWHARPVGQLSPGGDPRHYHDGAAPGPAPTCVPRGPEPLGDGTLWAPGHTEGVGEGEAAPKRLRRRRCVLSPTQANCHNSPTKRAREPASRWAPLPRAQAKRRVCWSLRRDPLVQGGLKLRARQGGSWWGVHP